MCSESRCGKNGALLSHSLHEDTIHVTKCGKLHPLIKLSPMTKDVFVYFTICNLLIITTM